jgi:hypothetical protein
MLSSVNSFGGLSAAELLTLFGANSSSNPSSSSNSTSTSTAQPESTGISGSSANAPANAIQAILAQAQITQTETSDGESVTSTTAQAAYAVQMGGSSSLLGAGVTMSTQYTSQWDGVSYSTSDSVTSVSSASTSDATPNPQAEQADYFQLAITIGNDTIAVGFTVDGLGQAGTAPLGLGYSVGQGNLADNLGMQVSADGQDIGIYFNVTGLDAAQAQKVAAAFEEATSAPNNGGTSGSYNEDYGPNFSAEYSVTVGYQTYN